MVRKLFTTLLLAFSMVPAFAAPSPNPSIVFNIGPAGFNCGQFTGSYACNHIPITINGQHGYLFMQVYYNGQLDGIEFSDINGNITPLGFADAESVSFAGNMGLVELSGPDLQAVPLANPSAPYTGTLVFTFTTYKSCYIRAGRGGGKVCYNYLTLNTAEIAVHY